MRGSNKLGWIIVGRFLVLSFWFFVVGFSRELIIKWWKIEGEKKRILSILRDIFYIFKIRVYFKIDGML